MHGGGGAHGDDQDPLESGNIPQLHLRSRRESAYRVHFLFALAKASGWKTPRLLRPPTKHSFRTAPCTWRTVSVTGVALAVASRVLGDLEGALAHHDAGAASIEACGAARSRALNGYEWAHTLLARDAPGDRQQATDMAEDTLAYCRVKGYTTFVEKTEELLARIR